MYELWDYLYFRCIVFPGAQTESQNSHLKLLLLVLLLVVVLLLMVADLNYFSTTPSPFIVGAFRPW